MTKTSMRARVPKGSDALRTDGQFAVPGSKSAVPDIPHGFLSLSRLEAGFDVALQCRLTAITGPAGYGKTTTLATLHAYAGTHGLRSGWLNLDIEDNDPIHFLQCVIAVLQQAAPQLGMSAVSQIRKGDAATTEVVLFSLCNELAKLDTDLGLFLDDYHVITNEAVHGAMDWLIKRSPRNLKLFIASRAPLPFALSKLRLARDLHEINASDLSLLPEESHSFVRTICECELSPTQIRILHERTEGWVTGLQLAALALDSAGDVPRFLDAFSGSNRDITTYLSEIVLSQLPADVSEFLMCSALFDRFSVSFCREALKQEQAVQMIDAVKARNLFVISLDRQDIWWRYHHLFADYLRNRFTLTSPDKARQLYASASAWFADHGLINEAIRYAFAAQDYALAADLISRIAHELVVLRGEHVTLLNWVAALPHMLVEQRPEIRLPYIAALMHTHSYAQAEAELASLEQEINADEAREMLPQDKNVLDVMARKAALMRLTLLSLTLRTVQAGVKGREWLARWEHSGAPAEVGNALYVIGYSAFCECDYRYALRCFVTAKRHCERDAAYYGVAWAETLRAMVELELGNVVQAEHVLAEAYKTISEKLGPYSWGGSVLLGMLAQACYEQNKLDEAERILNGIFLLMNGRSFGLWSLRPYLVRARLLWLRGRREDADACLAHGMADAERMRLRSMIQVLAAERVHLLLKNGQVAQATRVADELDLCSERHGALETAASDTGTRLIKVRLDAATGNIDRGLQQLNELIGEARQSKRATRLAKLLCVKACMLTDAGRRDEARRLVDEAMSIGATGGMCRSLVDEGAQVHSLVQEIGERRKQLGKGVSGIVPYEYLVQLQCAFGSDPIPAFSPAPVHHIFGSQANKEMLSKRELQILRLLDTGLSNRELAAQLFLSETTVRWHLRNIYEKLEVGNRVRAVAKARVLSLL